MYDYQSLEHAPINLRISAQSRKQEFVAYEITNNFDSAIKAVKDSLTHYQFYVLNWPTKKLILIPFKKAINSSQFDNLTFNFTNDDFRKMQYGENYRIRNHNNQIAFTHENPNEELIDAEQFTNGNQPVFNSQKIKEALKLFIQSKEFSKIKTDPLELRKLLHALANDVYKKLYPKQDFDLIIKTFEKEIPNFKAEYQTCEAEIKNNASVRSSSLPLGEYLQLYKTDHSQAQNIAEQMLSMMQKNFEPNPKMKLPIAGDLIKSIYPPALIDQQGKDRDNLVIFNPLTGTWINNRDIFSSLLQAIRPYSSDGDLDKVLITFAAEARNSNNFIKPYHASRHLLFKNCVLDIKTMQQHQFDETFIKELHFTERTKLNLNYNPRVVEYPIFPGKRMDGGDWDPYHFFMGYADNNLDKMNFFLFCLSLGLFAGHNFGINLDIKGDSRFGKTTLAQIFDALYGQRLATLVFTKLNEQFGLTNYTPQTSMVWVSECNEDAPPLNDEYGTTTYDAFADNSIHVQVKSNPDRIIENPPQLVVDGTIFVHAKNMDTGPAGRTLVYKLPMESDSQNPIPELIKQAYATEIKNLFHNETVLQWLINVMIEAYKTALNFDEHTKNRLYNLTLNLGGKSSDNQLLPEFARKWRQEMTESQGDIQDWFDYEFVPYLSKNKQDPTQMHNALAYGFYVQSYENKFSRTDPQNRLMLNQKTFDKQFSNLLSHSHWVKESNNKRKSIKYLSKTHFDIDRYKDDGYNVPKEFTNENIDKDAGLRENSYPLNQRVSGWYILNKE